MKNFIKLSILAGALCPQLLHGMELLGSLPAKLGVGLTSARELAQQHPKKCLAVMVSVWVVNLSIDAMVKKFYEQKSYTDRLYSNLQQRVDELVDMEDQVGLEGLHPSDEQRLLTMKAFQAKQDQFNKELDQGIKIIESSFFKVGCWIEQTLQSYG